MKVFNFPIFYVKNMSEEDKLSNFMSGQAEMRRQKVKDLSSATVVVDELVGLIHRARGTGMLEFWSFVEIQR